MLAFHIVANISLILITSLIMNKQKLQRYLFIRKHKQLALKKRKQIDREKLKKHIL